MAKTTLVSYSDKDSSLFLFHLGNKTIHQNQKLCSNYYYQSSNCNANRESLPFFLFPKSNSDKIVETGQDFFGIGCFSTTVGAIRELLRSCSSTSCSANQSSFSQLLCSPSLFPPKRTDSTVFCFSISSAIPVS